MSTPQLPAPAPTVNPDTEPFWSAAAEHRLVLPRCRDCATVIWYPRSLCPHCWSTDVEWFEAAGTGTIYSYSVNRKGFGAYRDAAPYVLAYVELAEGPRVLTNVVGDHEALHIGAAVRAVFHDTESGTALVRFELADA